jgi:uncharacterized repeat protein (TIGR01451 family)
MAADIASITGNVYTDLTDNGLTADDIDIQSATVRLFRDGGNSNFESTSGTATGDDTLIDTKTTDVNGNYLFQDLEAGRYFVQQAAVSGKVQRPSEALKTVDITTADASGVGVRTIDAFTDTSTVLVANSTSPSVSGVTATSGTNTIGDERDIVVNWVSGTNDIQARVDGGLLSVNPGAITSGNVVLIYDGDDGIAATIDHSRLNVDLSSGGSSAFQFLAGSVTGGNTITVDVFSGANNFSTQTTALPITAGAAPTEVLILRFADFTRGSGATGDANFAAVTALRIQIDAAAAAPAQIDLTQTVAPFVSTQNLQNLNPMSIGDRVWRDGDNDGVLDAGETGIENVVVQLYQDTNSSGTFNAGDTLVTTDTTDATGNYLFTNLVPSQNLAGNYFVVIPSTNFDAGEPLVGFTSSPNPDTSNNDANNRSKSTDLAGGGVVSNGFITLVAGGEPTNDGDTDTNTNLSLDFGFVPQFDLDVSNTVNLAAINAGQQVTYTLTVANNGPADASNVLVTEDLPNFATVTAQDITATGGTVTITNNANGEIEIRYPNIPATESRTVQIVATIPAAQAAQASVSATGSASASGVDSDSSNNAEVALFNLNRLAALQIGNTDTPDPAIVGQSLSYEILVTNVGPSTATNVQIRDTLPTGLTFASVNSTVGTAVHSNGLISLDLPSLAVGSSVTINVGTTIQSSFSQSTIENSATADADEAVLVTATSNTTINPQVDLAVTTTDSADPVARGGQVTYTLNVVNNGPSGASNVELVNTLSPDVTFISASGPNGTNVTPPTGNSRDVVIGIGSLAAAATANITVIAQVNQNAAASISNSAIVRSTESTGGSDTNTANNTDVETTATNRLMDLEISKLDSSTSQNPIRPGGTVTYTLTARNNGPSDASGVRVVDNIPDGLQVTAASIGSTSINIPSTAGDTTASNPDDLSFDVGSLASGATATLTVIANVLSATRGDLVNTAVISSTDTTIVDSVTTNNTASRTTTLSAQVDLAITNSSTVSSVVAGNALVYQIDVTNNGPSQANGVSINNPLPSGVTFSSATAQQGTVSHANGTVTGTLGTIAPGATVRVTVNATVDPSTRATLASTATVTSTEADASSTNNSSTASTSVTSSIDLGVTTSKANPNDPGLAGGSLTYTIIVSNNGPSAATNVVMTDDLPNGLAFTAGSVAGQSTTVSAAGQRVTANLGTLAPNESRTITIEASIANSAAGTVANTASIAATETDTNSSNNSATLNTPIAVVGTISGRTYLDSNRNGISDTGEAGVSGVGVGLTGSDILGRSVTQSTTTDANGDYAFNNLQPGTYTVSQTQPQGFRSAQSNPGSTGGTAGDNSISGIAITSGQTAQANNFGEVPNPLSLRRFLASSTQFD